MPNQTKKICQFINSYSFNRKDKKIISKVKLHLLDTLANIFAAKNYSFVQNAIKVLKYTHQKKESSLLGFRQKVNFEEAAFVNAIQAHAFDFDDAHKFVHPGCVVIPTVLALSEKFKISMNTFISAIVVGYEVAVRVALAANVEHRNRGYHPTSTCGIFGALAAAAKIMKLNKKQTESAIGLATSLASGITTYRYDGSQNKHLHAGFAVKNAILACKLAKKNVVGASNSLEGKLGFLEIYSNHKNKNFLNKGLGKDFLFLTTDLKTYPSCRQTHGALDLCNEIIKDSNFNLKEIKKISIGIYSYAYKPFYINKNIPGTELEAFLRIPYCVAANLVYQKIDMNSFSRKARNNKSVQNLIKKIHIYPEKRFDKNWPDQRPVEITVELKNKKIKKYTHNPLGSKDNPVSLGFYNKKFQDLLSINCSQKKTSLIFNSVNKLDEISVNKFLNNLNH
jgi:2-methylcitrate dehydratase PrpD|tara:strand:+ start:5239 stop:6591 length:1353 start_codon:yes stop_codon:yes gene_type:complete